MQDERRQPHASRTVQFAIAWRHIIALERGAAQPDADRDIAMKQTTTRPQHDMPPHTTRQHIRARRKTIYDAAIVDELCMHVPDEQGQVEKV